MKSINQRVILAIIIVLVFFLGLTGIALDKAFRKSAEAAVRDRLQAYIYVLLGASTLNDEGSLRVQDVLKDPRFLYPGTGLYARILDSQQQVIWKSRSMQGIEIPVKLQASVGLTGTLGQISLDQYTGKGDEKVSKAYFSFSQGIGWEVPNNKKVVNYFFQIVEDRQPYLDQIAAYRGSLWSWLVGLAVFLLLVQAYIMRWGLAPLRRVAADLEAVKAGEAEKLGQDYPLELQGLTSSVNDFIMSERAQKERYRNSMADLAHSLKTPLAVLQAGLHECPLDQSQRIELEDQITRMRKIMDYQLQRATLGGQSILGKNIPLRKTILRIVQSLEKVHHDRDIKAKVFIDEKLGFPGDEGDLFETVGNLLENAFKWANAIVQISAEISSEEGVKNLLLIVEDDGPGIAESQREKVLQRGVRADQTVSGHGIGLSVVQDVLEVYGGKIQIGSGVLGGARIQISFPLR